MAMQWQDHQSPNHIARHAGRRVSIQCRLNSELQPTAYGYQCSATTQGVLQDGTWQPAEGNIIVYLDSNTAQGLAPGQVAQLGGMLTHVGAMKNQGYARYLRTQGIYATLRAQALTTLPDAGDWETKLWQLKSYLLRQLAMHLTGEDIRGVAHALLLGSRAQLDPEVRHQYAATGATHILAVSGMHLSLLLALVSFGLTATGYNNRRWPWLSALVLLLVYAWLAGGSGSVVRAAGMSVLAVTATLLRRDAHVLNSLAAVWLGLLLFNPLWLHDAGLQLSCLAVLGIVLLYPAFYSWLLRLGKHWAWQAVAQLLAVSIAAQLFVLPLSVYVFGQFPTYFLITNLVAVPVGSLATIVGFAFLLLCWVPLVSTVLAFVLQASLEALNGYVYATAALPGATLSGLYLPAMWAVVLSLLVAGIGIWLSVTTEGKANQAPMLL